MRRHPALFLILSLAAASPAAAQLAADHEVTAAHDSAAHARCKEKHAKTLTSEPPLLIQHMRASDKRGINVFEPPKDDGIVYRGFRLDIGAGFAQQFQALSHENDATPNVQNGKDANELIGIGKGFNTASANLYLNAQVAPGIRVAMTSYLSSRHHNETWVKDGYMLIDESPIPSALLEKIFQVVTIKTGHFEINYGDAHFRRSDNGGTIYNPFVGNYILDAFTTEVGAEVYARKNDFLAMASVTGAEIKGNLTSPEDRSPAFITKLGFDRQVTPALRVRLTGSMYKNEKSPGNTLFGGDRAGSRYYYVLENTTSTLNGNFTSGLINPSFRYKVTSYQVNPFVKLGGLEFFGVWERADGRMKTELDERRVTQVAGDLVYRFLGAEDAYVGARLNRVEGRLPGMATDVSVGRSALAAGWFLTPNILMKGEMVRQTYDDFPASDIRSGGSFKGLVVEGVVAF